MDDSSNGQPVEGDETYFQKVCRNLPMGLLKGGIVAVVLPVGPVAATAAAVITTGHTLYRIYGD